MVKVTFFDDDRKISFCDNEHFKYGIFSYKVAKQYALSIGTVNNLIYGFASADLLNVLFDENTYDKVKNSYNLTIKTKQSVELTQKKFVEGRINILRDKVDLTKDERSLLEALYNNIFIAVDTEHKNEATTGFDEVCKKCKRYATIDNPATMCHIQPLYTKLGKAEEDPTA